jgi:hypothetical protein
LLFIQIDKINKPGFRRPRARRGVPSTIDRLPEGRGTTLHWAEQAQVP